MKKSLSPSEREAAFGWGYFALELFLLPQLLSRLNRLLPRPIPLLWLNMLFYAINFCVLAAIFHSFLRRSLLAASRRPWPVLGWAAGGLAGYICASLVWNFTAVRLFPGFVNVNTAAISAMAEGNPAALTIGAVVLVPPAEELLYRGLLFRTLAGKNRAAAYLVSVLCFSAVHVLGYVGAYPPAVLLLCFVQYFIPSVLLAWAYDKSGNLFSPILMHAAINAWGVLSLR